LISTYETIVESVLHIMPIEPYAMCASQMKIWNLFNFR